MRKIYFTVAKVEQKCKENIPENKLAADADGENAVRSFFVSEARYVCLAVYMLLTQ